MSFFGNTLRPKKEDVRLIYSSLFTIMAETTQQHNRKYTKKRRKNTLINLTNTKFTQHHRAFQTVTQY